MPLTLFDQASFAGGSAGTPIAGFVDVSGGVWADMTGYPNSYGNLMKWGTLTPGSPAGTFALNAGGSSTKVAAAYMTTPVPQADCTLYVRIPYSSTGTGDDNAGASVRVVNPTLAGSATGISVDFVPNSSGSRTLRLYTVAPGSTVIGQTVTPTSSVGDYIGARVTCTGGTIELAYFVNPDWSTPANVRANAWTVVGNQIVAGAFLSAGVVGIQSYASGAGTVVVGISDIQVDYTAAAPPTDIPINDANVHIFGGIRNGSTNAIFNNGGGYIKGGFTGTSLQVLIDATRLGSLGSAAQWPYIQYSIDGGAITTYHLASGDVTANVITKVLATGLTDTTHTFTLWIQSVDVYSDRWAVTSGRPLSAVIVTKFQVDNGKASAAPTLEPLRMGFDGNSITEGGWTGGSSGTSTNWCAYSDAKVSYIAGVAEALGAEYDCWGQGGTNYASGFASSGMPAYYKSDHTGFQEFAYSGGAKTFTGYDYWMVDFGANGTPSASDVTAALTRLRVLLGNDTVIFCVQPFGASGGSATWTTTAAAITSGFNAWTDAAGAGKSFLINLGSIPTLNTFNTASADSYDGLHPNGPKSGRLAADLSKAITADIGGMSVTITDIILTATTATFNLTSTNMGWTLSTTFSLVGGSPATITMQSAGTDFGTITITYGSPPNMGPYTISDGTNMFELPEIDASGLVTGGGGGQIVRTVQIGV